MRRLNEPLDWSLGSVLSLLGAIFVLYFLSVLVLIVMKSGQPSTETVSVFVRNKSGEMVILADPGDREVLRAGERRWITLESPTPSSPWVVEVGKRSPIRIDHAEGKVLAVGPKELGWTDR